MNILAEDVVSFKEDYCDEEGLIAQLLQQRLAHHLEEPILDVGSGTGKITATAFPDREVIHIDPLDYSDHALPPKHRRYTVDFFRFIPAIHVKTLLFSHVLQFIDDDVKLLNEKIKSLAPSKIIFVVNNNDDMMGEIVDWTTEHLTSVNPEVAIPGVPDSYQLVEQVGFTAQVACPDFTTLARQVLYLVDAETSMEEFWEVESFLRSELLQPSFRINQTIQVYA